MNMKIRASEKPESKDKVNTMGSVRNILNGRIQVIKISLAENRSQNGTSSLGPHMLAPVALRLFLAILSIIIVLLVSGTL